MPAAERIARLQGSAELRSEHLLLGVMSDAGSRWAALLEARGVGTYDTVRRTRPGLPSRAELGLDPPPRKRCPKPMRRVLVDLAIALVVLVASCVLRRRPAAPAAVSLPLGQDAALALQLATELAAGGEPTAGHLLVALASTPGAHIKLLRWEHQVVAAAARAELGLERERDRLLLAVHRPGMELRRLERRLRARRGLCWGAYGALRMCGVLWALVVFSVDTAATVFLYLFLWPALLLANGIRVVTGRLLGVGFTVRRAHEIPGGEMEISSCLAITDRRSASAVLAPRLVCFAVCAISMTLVLWPLRRLGVTPLPLLFARFDIVQGHVTLSALQTPVLLLLDAYRVHGVVRGTGILAGLGAGVFAIPSFREIQLIRLAGMHDVGRGSRVLRIVVTPLAALTSGFAFLEALLPFKGGPLYLTVYVVPLLGALAVGAQLDRLLPY